MSNLSDAAVIFTASEMYQKLGDCGLVIGIQNNSGYKLDAMVNNSSQYPGFHGQFITPPPVSIEDNSPCLFSSAKEEWSPHGNKLFVAWKLNIPDQRIKAPGTFTFLIVAWNYPLSPFGRMQYFVQITDLYIRTGPDTKTMRSQIGYYVLSRQFKETPSDISYYEKITCEVIYGKDPFQIYLTRT